jgi:glycerol-3-phosphate acyltransferase PlsY
MLGALAGVDIRKMGSGNVGATNVARVVGKRQGILTLIADTGKGFVPALVALQLDANATVVALVGVAAFLGHLYPVFLKFRGGKGVATAFGVLLGLAPLATSILIVIFAAVVLSSRIVSLASIFTSVAAPIVLWLFSYAPAFVAMSCFLGLMVVLRHRSNIERLCAGTEPKFGSS